MHVAAERCEDRGDLPALEVCGEADSATILFTYAIDLGAVCNQ
jgi:hypothetical protein